VQEAKESLHTDIFGNTKKVLGMGKVNMQNLRTPSTEEAREMQKKSAEKRSQNIKERKLIRQVIEERLGGADLEEIVDNLIDRAKHDSRDFEVLQSALGQKPVDKVMIADVEPSVIAEVEAMVNDDEGASG
jgi:hypothetical protein